MAKEVKTKVSVVCYELTIKGPDGKLCSLSDFSKEIDKDLILFLQKTVKKWTCNTDDRTKENESTETLNTEAEKEKTNNVVVSPSLKKVFKVSSNYLKLRSRSISGFIETGDFGVESSIIKIETGEEVYKKGSNEAELLPFYFNFFIPRVKARGLLVLQRIKNLGVLTVLSRELIKEFKERYKDYTLAILPLVSRKIIERFIEKGGFRKVKFITYDPSQEQKNSVMHDPNDTAPFHCEHSIIANSGKQLSKGFLDRIIQSVKDKRSKKESASSLTGLRDVEFERIEITLRLDGHERTMKVDNDLKIGAFEDLTNVLDYDEFTGLPKPQSIINEVEGEKGVINFVKKEMYPEDN